jgi:chromate transport protein ChrA
MQFFRIAQFNVLNHGKDLVKILMGLVCSLVFQTIRHFFKNNISWNFQHVNTYIYIIIIICFVLFYFILFLRLAIHLGYMEILISMLRMPITWYHI